VAFAHLHVHSQYSLLNGVNTPKELAAAAKAHGQPALALTDTANLYGAVELYKACKDAKIHPVFGAELWLDPRGVGAREGRLDQAFQVVLLVEDEVGYRNLCGLVTRAIFDGLYYRPRVDWELLEAHAQGLICLTGSELGAIRLDEATPARLDRLARVFGEGHLYAELADPGTDGSAARLARVREEARRVGIGTVVTNDVRYVEPSDAVLLEVLNSIAQGASLNDPRRPRLLTDQLSLKSEEELRALFPEDGDAIDRAGEIAERTHYSFPSGVYYFPSSRPPEEGDTDANWRFFVDAFPPPRDFGVDRDSPRPEGAGTLNGYFFWFARQGLIHRLARVPEDRHAEYHTRLERELTMIEKMGFAAYLLIVAEFINWAKDRGIPVGPGRGSAAGSLVTYAMRITDIDPVRYVLLFERFLNPERVSMPDIDVDFAQDRREEVIQHVRVKYGAELVSQIITYGKLQAKAALKDVARVCDLSFQESDRITKLVPARLNISIAEAVKEEPRLADLCASDPKVRRVVELARGIEGITRQTGVHAAGVLIADRPLVTLAPLYRDGADGGPVVQYDMKSAESIGLIKFDFLGLKTLDQIRDAVAMIERNTGEHIDIDAVPVEDPRTWALLQKGDGLGVFQVESSGMRELLTRLRPSNIDDLVALVALYRPGPLSSGMVDDFIDRKHGRKEVTYLFPELREILEPTYGTIVYQEQVMQVAQVLAGYSLGEADLLRRAMGKKDAAEMAKQKTRFVTGAVARGHAEQRVGELFDLLAKFAEYGFNKSHSAAYGYVAYQTAWLKAHHRAAYMAALMTIDAGDSDKILVYIGDCRRAGITILPPDIHTSVRAFDVPRGEDRTIRYGLAAVKGLGDSAIAALLEAREAAGGRFRDFWSFVQKLDWKRVNKKVLECLVKCGALDSFGEPRARMIAGLEDAMAAAQAEAERIASGQMGLFGGLASAPSFRLPRDVGEWAIGERMRFEKESLGLFITGHPVMGFADEIERWGITPLDRLGQQSDGGEVRICGVVAGQRVIRNKRGDKMAFVTLEDMHGTVDVVLFADVLARSQAALAADKPLLVTGKFERREKGDSVRVDTIELMEDLRERRTRAIELRVRSEELGEDTMASMSALFAANAGGASVSVVVEEAGAFEATVRLGEQARLAATPRLVDGLRALFGRTEAVRLA